MLSVKGTFRQGVAQPLEPVTGHEGKAVIITFLDEKKTQPTAARDEGRWEEMTELVEYCTVETGISDLAHQHEHYLYGKLKKV